MPVADLQLRACLDEPFVILGQRMQPLRLGHVEMLHKWDVVEIRNPTELIQAVLICSNWPRDVERYCRRRSLRVWLWMWILRLQKWDFASRRMLFEAYLSYHLTIPEVHVPHANGSESAIPFHQRLRAILCSRLNYNPNTVGNVTMQRALWDYYAWAESEGRLSVLPQTGEEIAEALAAIDGEEILARVNGRKT